jgi:hypothetical protein
MSTRSNSAIAATIWNISRPEAVLRSRLSPKLEHEAKLNFQVLRRTIATLAQTKGSVKDVHGILGHSKADTTVNAYIQPIEEGVKQTLEEIYAELTAWPQLVAVC